MLWNQHKQRGCFGWLGIGLFLWQGGCLLMGGDCLQDIHCPATTPRCVERTCRTDTPADIERLFPVGGDALNPQKVVVRCTTNRRCWKVSCWLDASLFAPKEVDPQRSDIECMTITQRNKRPDGAWIWHGEWRASDCSTPVEFYAKTSEGTVFQKQKTNIYLSGNCFAMSDLCLQHNYTCDKHQTPDGTLRCGDCPYGMSCQEGRCVCQIEAFKQCQGTQLVLLDGCDPEQPPRAIESCPKGCLYQGPFQADTCRSQTPTEICQMHSEGSFCDGSTVIVCEQGRLHSEQFCPDGCVPTTAKCRDRRAFGHLQHSFGHLQNQSPELCAGALDPRSRLWGPVVLGRCEQKASQMWRWLEKSEQIEHLSGACLSAGDALYLNARLAPCDLLRTDTRWERYQGGFRTALTSLSSQQRFLQPFGVLPWQDYIEGSPKPQITAHQLLGQRLFAYPYHAPTRSPFPTKWSFQF